MPGARDLRLDQEEVRARLRGQLRVMPRGRRRRGDGGDPATSLDAGDEGADQLVARRLIVGRGQHPCGLFARRRRHDAFDDRRCVLVPGIEPFEVDERQAAGLRHAQRNLDVRYGIHGRRHEGDRKSTTADLHPKLDFGRIDGHLARNERDLLESVGPPQSGADHVLDGASGHRLVDHRRRPGSASKRPADGVSRRGL